VLLVCCAGIVVLGGAGAQAKPDVKDEVRAKRFVLVDDAGKERAALESFPDGQARLVVRGKDKAATYCGIMSNGTAIVTLATPGGQRVVELGTVDEAPIVILRDASDKLRIGMTIGENGSAGVVIRDGQGAQRLSLEVGKDGTTEIRALDAKGTVLWRAPGTP